MSGLWAHRDFRRLWLGRTIAAAGFQVGVLALQLTAAVSLNATPFEMGLLVAANSAPALVWSLLAGVWVDRLRRRRLLIVADLGRAALLVTIPIAWLGGWLAMPQLLVVAFAVGTLTTMFDIAALAYVPSLVGRERLLPANTALQSSAAAMNIGGPGLAGALVQWLTAPIAIVANAVGYVASALSIAAITTAEPPPPTRRDGLRRQIAEGFGYLLARPVLRQLALAGGTFALFTGMRSAAVVLYLVDALSVEAFELGLVWSFAGIGGLMGATAAGWAARRLGTGRVLIAAHSIGLFAALTPFAGFLPPSLILPTLIVASLGMGFMMPVYSINETTLRQSLVEDHMLGRMSATSSFLFHGVVPVGALLGGALASLIGLQQTLFLSAAGAVAGVVWFAPSWMRRLR